MVVKCIYSYRVLDSEEEESFAVLDHMGFCESECTRGLIFCMHSSYLPVIKVSTHPPIKRPNQIYVIKYLTCSTERARH